MVRTGWIAAALLLAACGSGGAPSGQLDVTDIKDNASAAAALGAQGAGMVSSAGLPDFVEFYRGGKPTVNMVKREENGETGGMFAYRVDAKAADVVAFHRASAQRNGISFDTEMQMGAGMTLAGQSKDEKKVLAATIAQEEEAVTVTLTYSDRRGARAGD